MQAEPKTDVALIQGWGKKRLALGQMSWDEAKAYQTELTAPLPKDSCFDTLMTELHAEVRITGKNMRCAPKPCKLWEYTPVTKLQIELSFYRSKCITPHECFDNIKSGKCTDPYAIEHIGKKFFADKYVQKTK